MRHLFAVGVVYLDTILSVPHFPEEDSKLRASQVQTRRGGNASNSLEVLGQLLENETGDPVSLHLISPLPEKGSKAVELIRSSFFSGGGRGINFEECLYRKGHHQAASSYIIRSVATGSRTIVNHNELPEMTIDEFADIVSRFRETQTQDHDESWWHFEGRIPETTLRCIQQVRCLFPTACISVEAEKPERAGLDALAAEADVVFYSKSYAEGTSVPRDLGTFLSQQAAKMACKAKLLLVTCGAGGAYGLSAGGEGFLCPVQIKSHVIDSVGAGDTFIAGVLYGLICHDTDWDARRTVSFAVELASCKVGREGFGGLAVEMERRQIAETIIYLH